MPVYIQQYSETIHKYHKLESILLITRHYQLHAMILYTHNILNYRRGLNIIVWWYNWASYYGLVLIAKTSTKSYDPAANAQSSPISSSNPIFYCSETAADPARSVGLSTCHRGRRVLWDGSLPLICLPADADSELDMWTRGRRRVPTCRPLFNRCIVPFTTPTWPKNIWYPTQ